MLIELMCMITFNKESGANWCEWELFGYKWLFRI